MTVNMVEDYLSRTQRVVWGSINWDGADTELDNFKHIRDLKDEDLTAVEEEAKRKAHEIEYERALHSTLRMALKAERVETVGELPAHRIAGIVNNPTAYWRKHLTIADGVVEWKRK